MYPGSAANLTDGSRVVNWLIRDDTYEDIVPNFNRCPIVRHTCTVSTSSFVVVVSGDGGCAVSVRVVWVGVWVR